jgi:hypothetical protein
MTPTWLDRLIWITLALVALTLAANAADAVMRAAAHHTITIRPVEPCRLVRVDDGAMSHNPFTEVRDGE